MNGVTLQEMYRIAEERGFYPIILSEKYQSLEIRRKDAGHPVLLKKDKLALLEEFPDVIVLNAFDSLIFSFDTFPRIRYVGLTKEALKFVGISVSGRYYTDSNAKVSKMMFEAFPLVEICGEPITGWIYNRRYVEKVQRIPWFGNACFIYTYLGDIETGHKLFQWKVDRDQKLEFNIEHGTFKR